jgi:gluconokinase
LIVVLMGVAGAGKTVVGRALAATLGWEFFDADDFHSAANIARMTAGVPLTDADREPWLATLQSLVRDLAANSCNAVLACSALRTHFRERLGYAAPTGDMRFVYLKAPPDLVIARLAARTEHFMPPTLIDSQFASLEEPHNEITVDASAPPEAVVAAIRAALGI